MNNSNYEESNTLLKEAVSKGKVLDLGVPIHRTNPVPLDLSTIIYLENNSEINNYKTDEDFRTAARTKINEKTDATRYPGQQIAVIGKVNENYCVSCFILQQDDNHLELVYKSDVDAIKDNLGQLQNQLGDITPAELAKFIGIEGNNFKLPSSTLVSDPESLIDFIKQADKFLGYKIGILDDSGNLKMPEVTAGDKNHLGYSLVDYINNADTNVKNAITVEANRAKEAEADLLTKINAIDFVDTTKLAEAIKNFATDSELEAGLDLKTDKTDFNSLKTTVEAFLTGNGTEAALDSLKELIEYIETHDHVELADLIADVQSLTNKLVLGTYSDGKETKEYSTVKAYVEAAIAALKIWEYAKAADLDALATKTELNAKVSNTEFNQFKTANAAAIDAAKNEAIADARFQENLTLTYKFGKYEPDDTGSFVLPCAGKTMKEVLLDAFAQEIYEGLILTVPTVSFSLSGTNATNTDEVGTTHGSPAAKLDLNISGSYKYGAKTSTGTLADPDTAIKATSARILMNNVTKISMNAANPNADLTYTHTLTGDNLKYKDGTDTYTFVAYASHGADDNRPLTNLGNFVSGSPGNYTGTTEFSKAVGHITAKSETEFCNGKTVSVSYTGYRKMFMGTVSTDPAAINSNFIRGLNKISKKAAKGAQEFTVSAGQKSFYVAIPTSLTTAMPTFKYKFFGNWEALSGVIALDTTVDVEGANGYEAKPYKVYVYTPAVGSFEANTDIQVTIN